MVAHRHRALAADRFQLEGTDRCIGALHTQPGRTPTFGTVHSDSASSDSFTTCRFSRSLTPNCRSCAELESRHAAILRVQVCAVIKQDLDEIYLPSMHAAHCPHLKGSMRGLAGGDGADKRLDGPKGLESVPAGRRTAAATAAAAASMPGIECKAPVCCTEGAHVFCRPLRHAHPSCRSHTLPCPLPRSRSLLFVPHDHLAIQDAGAAGLLHDDIVHHTARHWQVGRQTDRHTSGQSGRQPNKPVFDPSGSESKQAGHFL